LFFFVGVAFSFKAFYDLALCHTNWKALDTTNEGSAVEIWNSCGLEEFQKAKQQLFHELGEIRQNGKMTRNSKSTFKLFSHWRIFEFEGDYRLSLPISSSSLEGDFIIQVKRGEKQRWNLVRSYIETKDKCISITN